LIVDSVPNFRVLWVAGGVEKPEVCPDDVHGMYFNGDTDRVSVKPFGFQKTVATIQFSVK